MKLRNTSRMLCAAVFFVPLAGCDSFEDPGGITIDEIKLIEENARFEAADTLPELDGPGQYRATSRLVGLYGQGMDDIAQAAAWNYYHGVASEPLLICVKEQDADRGMRAMLESMLPPDCMLQRPGTNAVSCVFEDGITRRVATAGMPGRSPDFRVVWHEPDGTGAVVELIWHTEIERVGPCQKR